MARGLLGKAMRGDAPYDAYLPAILKDGAREGRPFRWCMEQAFARALEQVGTKVEARH